MQSRVLRHPKIIWTILTHIPTLDPLVIVLNSKIILAKSADGKIAAFVAIKKFNDGYELGTVYTYPKYRNQGLASNLIQQALSTYQPIGLLCKRELVSYYEKFGFRECAECGNTISKRRKLFNTFLKPLFGYPIVLMMYIKTLQ